MKRLRLSDLDCQNCTHIRQHVIPGKYLAQGGLSFKEPGMRTHDTGCTCDSCNGKGRHAHDDYEVFGVLHGHARMEVDGETHGMDAGDVRVCEPGEDHHLISDEENPCVNLWLHASDTPHEAHRT